MIWSILLYYVWIIIALFCLYLMYKCIYTDKGFTNKATYPAIVYISLGAASFVPGINFLISVGLVFYICAQWYDHELYVKHWLFKNL